MIRFSITGDAKLDALLRELGQTEIKSRQIKQGLRKLAKPVIRTMRKKAKAKIKATETKQLSRSIGVIKGVKSPKEKPFILVGPRYYWPALNHPVDIVEFGKEKFDVEYEGKKFVEKTFNEHKTKLTSELRKLVIETIDKKLKKLRS